MEDLIVSDGRPDSIYPSLVEEVQGERGLGPSQWSKRKRGHKIVQGIILGLFKCSAAVNERLSLADYCLLPGGKGMVGHQLGIPYTAPNGNDDTRGNPALYRGKPLPETGRCCKP